MHGLNANYYQPGSEIPADLIHTQVDPVIDYEYYCSVPPPMVYGTSPGTVDIQWAGWIIPLYTETYTFTIDGGVGADYCTLVGEPTTSVYLTIGGTTIISSLFLSGTINNTISLVAGVPVRIVLGKQSINTDFFCKLSWQSASQAFQLVPDSAFYANDTTGATLSAAPSPILQYRDSSTLTWTTDNASSASIDNGVGPVSIAGGSVVVSPTVTTTYTLTVTGPFGTTTAQATVVVVPKREVHVFETGLLQTSDGKQFAVLQSVNVVPLKVGRRTLYDCPRNSKFPVDVGLFGGGASIVAAYAGINHDALQEVLGATETVVGSTDVETLSQLLQATAFTLVLTTQDTTGKQQTWTFNKVRVDAFEIPSKVGDFTVPRLSMTAYPDASGVVATIALPW